MKLAYPIMPLLVAILASSAKPSDLDPKIIQLLNSVSEKRIEHTLKKLEDFETRNILSSTDSKTHGIGAARQWIFDELKSYSPKLQVSFDLHRLEKKEPTSPALKFAGGFVSRDLELRNVVAILPGKSERRIYVAGHYDTVARPGGQSSANAGRLIILPTFDPNAPVDTRAPGVNDDGSGVALTLELARVFAQSGIAFDATLVFICHAGEEQGLLGSKQHAEKAAHDKLNIQAVFNNDIVGGDTGGNGIVDGSTVRLYSEGPEDSPSRSLARFVERWGSRYLPSHKIRLLARVDRFKRGSDHMSYNAAGYPAVCFREARENFDRQHDPRDTFEGVSIPYLVRNAKVNAAAAATLALAPVPPVVEEKGQPLLSRSPSGYDANLSWKAAPRAVAYRIFWREAWGQDWQHDLMVGNVTNYVMPDMQIDDYVFGVSAIDNEGHESTVSVMK